MHELHVHCIMAVQRVWLRSPRSRQLSSIPTSMASTSISSSSFRSILDSALDDYSKQTGIQLSNHPSAEQFQNCQSPDDIIRLLLQRENEFKDYRAKYRKLIDLLRPVVQVVHGFSNVLGDAAGLVSSADGDLFI